MTFDDKIKNQAFESSPLLPSGEWEGFYCYFHTPTQHKMFTELTFSKSIVSGSGVDDVSAFTWAGKYNLEHFKIKMTKQYLTHKVFYKGDIDENGIWGTWEITSYLTGGFHIWPKKNNSNTSRLEKQIESKKLEEIFMDVFSNGLHFVR